MPSWWIPASCANALRPMIALFGCTGTRVISASIWLAGIKLLAGHRRFIRIAVGAHSHRHDNFFERSVARTLTDAVDRAFHLARAVLHASQGVRYRQSQIVVAVRGDRTLSMPLTFS